MARRPASTMKLILEVRSLILQVYRIASSSSLWYLRHQCIDYLGFQSVRIYLFFHFQTNEMQEVCSLHYPCVDPLRKNEEFVQR